MPDGTDPTTTAVEQAKQFVEVSREINYTASQQEWLLIRTSAAGALAKIIADPTAEIESIRDRMGLLKELQGIAISALEEPDT